MKFMVDECTGPAVAKWLENKGHDVFSVYEVARGESDIELIRKAKEEDYILITNDKDFGELVFRLDEPHSGIILLRLDDERSENKKNVLKELLKYHRNELKDNFVVVTEEDIRIVEM